MPMRRPWRLTRRERVAMESALANLRKSLGSAGNLESYVRDAARVLDANIFRTVDRWWHQYSHPLRGWRTARARIAIALRAALRADEDARAEDVYVRACELSRAMRNRNLAYAARDGAWWAIAEMREWPVKRTHRARMPLALWEADRGTRGVP